MSDHLWSRDLFLDTRRKCRICCCVENSFERNLSSQSTHVRTEYYRDGRTYLIDPGCRNGWPAEHESDCTLYVHGACNCPMGNLRGVSIPRAQFIGGVWVHPSPAETEFSWYNVTTWADRDWKAAQASYWHMMSEARFDPRKIEQARGFIKAQRESYRARILSWYRKLCMPMQPGECVPNSVAELLAEEWDEATR